MCALVRLYISALAPFCSRSVMEFLINFNESQCNFLQTSSNKLLSLYSKLINNRTHKVNNNRTVCEYHHFFDNYRFIFHTENVNMMLSLNRKLQNSTVYVGPVTKRRCWVWKIKRREVFMMPFSSSLPCYLFLNIILFLKKRRRSFYIVKQRKASCHYFSINF